MMLKRSIFYTILCLFIGLSAVAQDTIVTIEEVKIDVSWTGSGSITTNGVELGNDLDLKNTVTAADGSVVLTATGDAQLTNLVCYNDSLSTLDITKCPLLVSLICFDFEKLFYLCAKLIKLLNVVQIREVSSLLIRYLF